MPEIHPSAETPSPSGTSLLLRIFWMFIGNFVLIVSLLAIAMGEEEGFFSIADVVFWVAVPLIIAARYVDIARYGGTNADGEPATLAHWRRYAIGLAVLSVVLWGAAHGIHAIKA
jgi:hypothetical protein